MLWCSKCGGRVFVDRTFEENKKMELSCCRCGRRMFVDKVSNPFGKFMSKKELQFRRLQAG